MHETAPPPIWGHVRYHWLRNRESSEFEIAMWLPGSHAWVFFGQTAKSLGAEEVLKRGWYWVESVPPPEVPG